MISKNNPEKENLFYGLFHSDISQWKHFDFATLKWSFASGPASVQYLKMQKPQQICKQSLFLFNLNIFLFSSPSGNSEASSFCIGRVCLLSWQAKNSGPGSWSLLQHWFLLAGPIALYSQHCHFFFGGEGGAMFHFGCLQMQEVCVGFRFVVCWYGSGRTPLHPLHMPSPSLVEEQWQLQLGLGLCWQKVLRNATEKRKCFICLTLSSQLFWQLLKEKSLIFFWPCFLSWGEEK